MTAKKPSGERVSYTQLCTDIAEATGSSRLTVKAVLDSLGDQVISHLYKGRDVAVGIGSFKRRDKKAKKAVKGGQTKTNPFTGEEYVTTDKPAVPSQAAAKFFPAKKLKDGLLK